MGYAGVGGGFIFSFITLLVAVIFFFLSNFFVPNAVNALNATAASLNVTNTPSPKIVFGWAILVFSVIILLEAFFVGYGGGFDVAIGFFIGAVLILLLLGSTISHVAPGSPFSIIISLFVVFLGAFLSK